MPAPDRFTVVLFGATGDLALRKLIPALFSLHRQGLARDFVILATARRDPDRERYLARLREHVSAAREHADAWHAFERLIEYTPFDAEDPEGFARLARTLGDIERERGFPRRRLFYLSVAPDLFATVTDGLAESGVLRRDGSSADADAWHRIVVEKPFGHDLASAKALDAHLKRHVDEAQVYRIDHYLGKETVQNLVAFRFANGLIEPLWTSQHVASVQITVAETLGVGDRAGYYDSAGAVRDMLQNHMMQLLALTAMEPPLSLAPDDVRNEKVRVLRSIRIPKTPEEVAATAVRGQYGPAAPGAENGEEMRAYRDEPGVDPRSITPTYAAVRLHLDTWRWTGVPFYLRHGKRLPRRLTEIAVRFRTPPLHLFRSAGCDPQCPNVLTIRIQPDEGIHLRLGAKRPGPGINIENIDLGFDYPDAFAEELPEAYERLLLDAVSGDPTLFIRQDEVEASWAYADAILKGWDALPPPSFPNYASGTDGPAEAEMLFEHSALPRNGEPPDGWRPLAPLPGRRAPRPASARETARA